MICWQIILKYQCRHRRPHSQPYLPYQEQVETWCQQGIQATTIHAALQRQHGFKGSYEAVAAICKKD